MAQRQRAMGARLLAQLGLILALAGFKNTEEQNASAWHAVPTAAVEGYFTSPEGINQLVAKSRVDVAAGWSINRSTGRLEDGVVAAGNFRMVRRSGKIG